LGVRVFIVALSHPNGWGVKENREVDG